MSDEAPANPLPRTRCPKCGIAAPMYAIACEGCGVIFSEYDAALRSQLVSANDDFVKQLEQRVYRRLTQKIILAFSVFAVVTGGGLWQIYSTLRDVSSRAIAKQFEEPHIRQTVVDAANARASALLEKDLRPSLEKAQHDTQASLQQFNENLQRALVEAKRAADMASPPTLRLESCQSETQPQGQLLRIRFLPSKNQPLGSLIFVVVLKDPGARILSFEPDVSAHAFVGGKATIEPDGMGAKVVYSPRVRKSHAEAHGVAALLTYD